MSVESLTELVRSTGLAGLGVAGVAVLVLGAVLGVLVMARRSGGGSPERQTALDDALAVTGAATIAIRLRGDRLGLTHLSASVESLTGYTAETLCEGDAFLRMVSEEEAADLERKLVAAIRDERATVADFAYQDADGLTRWMQVRVEPAPGGRNALRGIVREITEHRRLSHDLSETSSRFHALADATPAMLWVLDPEGQATAVNRATERFCGASEAALLGEGWLLAVDESDHDGLRQFLARVLDEGMSLNRDVTMIDPDNRERQIAMTATVAKDSDGHVASVVLTGRDVTDRSQAERQRERLKRLIESSESPAMILTPDLRVSMMNPAARSLAGLADGESADSIALWHVVTQEAADRIRGEAARYCADGGVFQMPGSMRDGADGSLSAELAVVGLGDGWLGINARITEQDLAREAAFEDDRRRLDVVDAVLDRFAGGVALAADRVCASLSGVYPSFRAAFCVEGDEGVLACEVSEEPPVMGSARGRAIRLVRGGSLLASLRAGEMVTVDDVWSEDQLAGGALELEATESRALALCPVPSGNGGLRVLVLERTEAEPWQPAELAALRWSASLLGLALGAEQERSARLAGERSLAERGAEAVEARERADELATVVSRQRIDLSDLENRLARAGTTWSGALVSLASRAAEAQQLADEARGAGLADLADRLDRLASDADRAEVSGRIAAGTLAASATPEDPREVLREVGQRVLAEATGRGVTLRISKEGELPETFTTDRRLLSLACGELLRFAVERCASGEVRAIARPSDDGVSLSVSVGRVGPPASDDVPGGMRLLRELGETLGGSLETENDAGGEVLTLRVSDLATGSEAASDGVGGIGGDLGPETASGTAPGEGLDRAA